MTASTNLKLLASVLLVAGLGAAACAAESTETESTSSDSTATTLVEVEATTTTETTEATTTTVAATDLITIPEPLPVDESDGWTLVWSDEFDGDTINLDNWTYDLGGWGWGNGEAQTYTDRPENARLENGLLVIEARQEQYDGGYYTSARMKTEGLQEFKYGRIEARLKVPEGAGTWPAFWMLGSGFSHDATEPEFKWPNVGEIDVMEYIGREPDLVMGTIHGPGYAGALGLTRWNRQDFPIADEFHTYAIEWDESGISWFFDGELYNTLTPADLNGRDWVFDKEFFMIVNLAIGGTLPGPIGLDVEFPLYLYVDHVRVYQQVGAS